MQNEGSNGCTTKAVADDLEKQENTHQKEGDSFCGPEIEDNLANTLTIVISNGDSSHRKETTDTIAQNSLSGNKQESPIKGYLSRSNSSHEQCRICQQDKEEDLINLGCQCRGGLAKAHRSCIDAWFRTKGSNQCEICQTVAVNVSPPEPQPAAANYWVWRVDANYRRDDPDRGCFSPLWVAFSILIGGLMLDVLISMTLGVSALPVNIIIGVIVVLGLGTALRLALEFCYQWTVRRSVQRAEANLSIAYPPTL